MAAVAAKSKSRLGRIAAETEQAAAIRHDRVDYRIADRDSAGRSWRIPQRDYLPALRFGCNSPPAAGRLGPKATHHNECDRRKGSSGRGVSLFFGGTGRDRA